MLSPETNATTNATTEETNATAEAQTPGGRVKSWTTKDNKFLLGAAAATAGGVGSVVALAAAAAIIPPDPPPNVEVNLPVDPPGVGGGIDPEFLEYAQENAVTIYSVVVDENGEIIRELGHGSGFFIGGTEGRLIGTAAHVVDNSDIDLQEGEQVQTFVRVDGGELEGTVFPVDPPSGPAVDGVNDIAILDIGQTTVYPGIPIAPPGSAELGEELWTISVPWDKSLAGTVGDVTVASTEGQRIDGQETEDVLQLHGITHGGESGSLVIDSEGRLVAIITHGIGGYFPGSELTITFATKSERLAELLEQYRNSPEFLELAEGVVSGQIEPAVLVQWLESQDDGGVTDSDLTKILSDDGVKDVLIIGDKASGFGPWSPDSPPDDGGVINSVLEALDALV